MNKTEMEKFLFELKELLQKYKASISFSASECSDWHGIHNYGIELYINDGVKSIKFDGGTTIYASDIRLN